ncbi:MAG: sulfoxide reductase heme-binding subunit YedZ [Bauldia sp.]|nr:sulfoxide reductase heme-binding subunit YedZ [Bauldia sp.]
MPWNDRAGRFAPLKAAALVLVSLPALWLIVKALSGGMGPGQVAIGPRPFNEAIRFLGGWTIYLLLITLAITPARRLFDWSKLIQVRRIFGVSALVYILAHFTLYVIDSRLDLAFVAKEIVLRVYLLIGFTALVGLIVLGVTSTDGMVKRLGAIRWNRLHKLVYVITALGILHYYMQSKIDVTQPVLMTGFFAWLMGYRLMAARGYKEGLVPLLVLSVSAALLTAAAEAAWYGIATGIGAWRPLLANLDFSYSIRPAWWVLAAGLAVTFVSELRKRLKPRSAPQQRRTAAGRA